MKKYKWKKKMAVGVILAMLTGTLAGCGNSEQIPENTVDSAESEPVANSSNYNVTWDEMAEITIAMTGLTSNQSGLKAVEDAINEITEKEINTHVNIKMFEYGNYAQQVGLMISSNEQLDLIQNVVGTSTAYSVMTNQNQLTDITELLQEYAPRAYEEAKWVLGATTINDSVYAFPAYHNFVTGVYIMMRTDVLEDLGLLEKAESISSFSEYEEILEAVRASEEYGDLVGIVAGSSSSGVLPYATNYAYADNFSDITFIDNLGNSLQCVGISTADDSEEIINVYASDAYYNNYRIVKDWYDKGYIYADTAITQDTGLQLIKSGVAFSTINSGGVGMELSMVASAGRDMTMVKVAQSPVTADRVTNITWGVPITTKEPEAATVFLELAYENSDIANLMAYGTEGVDYEIGEDGVADYIEGNENPSYHNNSYMCINELVCSPWVPEKMENWMKQSSILDEAESSKYLNFSVDVDTLASEISALSTVIAEYKPQIIAGVASEEDYRAFCEKLESSGINTVLSYYDEKFQEWKEN